MGLHKGKEDRGEGRRKTFLTTQAAILIALKIGGRAGMAANFDAASLAERTTARGATECAPSSRSTAHILKILDY